MPSSAWESFLAQPKNIMWHWRSWSPGILQAKPLCHFPIPPHPLPTKTAYILKTIWWMTKQFFPTKLTGPDSPGGGENALELRGVTRPCNKKIGWFLQQEGRPFPSVSIHPQRAMYEQDLSLLSSKIFQLDRSWVLEHQIYSTHECSVVPLPWVWGFSSVCFSVYISPCFLYWLKVNVTGVFVFFSFPPALPMQISKSI